MLESTFKKKFRADLERLFPNCIILTSDPINNRSFPDLVFLYEDFWAGFEIKRSETSSFRPNQDYKVSLLNRMSYARLVYPENRLEVLNELERYISQR